MAKQVKSEEKKPVAYNVKGKHKGKAVEALSNIEIKANVGVVAAWKEVLLAIKAGEMSATTEHAERLLKEINAAIIAYREKHNDVRHVAPINAQRTSEVLSIMRLSELKCGVPTLQSLEGYDLGRKDIVNLARKIRKDWKWNVEAAKPLKSPAQLIQEVRVNRMAQHATSSNTATMTPAQRQAAKEISKRTAVQNVDKTIGVLRGLFAAMKGDAKIERAINGIINDVRNLRPSVVMFAK
jgi:hypothetical protein